MRLRSIGAVLGLALSLTAVTAARADNAPFNTSGLRVFVSDEYTNNYGLPNVVSLSNEVTEANSNYPFAKAYVAFLKQPPAVSGGGFEEAAKVQDNWQFHGLAPYDYLLITLSRGGGANIPTTAAVQQSRDQAMNWTVGVAVGRDVSGFALDPAHDSDIVSLINNNKIRLHFKDDVAEGDVNELVQALSGDLARVLDDRVHHRDDDIHQIVSLRAAQAVATIEPAAAQVPVNQVAHSHGHGIVYWLLRIAAVCGATWLLLWFFLRRRT
jgi:hypothetical protein